MHFYIDNITFSIIFFEEIQKTAYRNMIYMAQSEVEPV